MQDGDMTSLLERAKNIKTRRKKRLVFSEEELSLYVAWLKEEVTIKQIATAMGLTGANLRYRMLVMSKQLFEEGRLKVE